MKTGKTAERTTLLGIARCLSDGAFSGRTVLPSLLCAIDPSARTARGALLCTTLSGRSRHLRLLLTQGHLRVVSSKQLSPLN